MNLSEIRKQIDALDAQILKALNNRAKLAQKVGQCKAHANSPYYVPCREEALLKGLSKKNKGPLSEASVRAIYKEIISACTAQQKSLRIAYLGPEATYTHQAALKNFGHSLPMRAMATIPDVFAAVEKKEVDYGVVPIENSTEGAVFHSLDMLVESELKIIAQIFLPITQCLLSNGPLEKINRVLSKDVALGQCRKWLHRHLPQVELVAVNSTARAAQQAAKEPGVAAIASALAGELYGVKVLEKGIQDCAQNVTRFLVLGTTAPAPAPKEPERTTIVFSCVKDEVGTLEKALAAFSRRGVNLCKIESRPSRKKMWEYYFFVDCLGHRDDPGIDGALRELAEHCPFVKWLGSYPEVGV